MLEPSYPPLRSPEAHPACRLARKGIHQGLDPVVHQHGGVEQKLLVAVVLGAHPEEVGHERMPVVQLVELHGDAVAVLELGPEQQLWVELELQEVAAQLLHVLLYHNLDGLPWDEGWGPGSAELAVGLGKRAGSREGLALTSFSLLRLFDFVGPLSPCLFVTSCENGTFCLRLDKTGDCPMFHGKVTGLTEGEEVSGDGFCDPWWPPSH